MKQQRQRKTKSLSRDTSGESGFPHVQKSKIDSKLEKAVTITELLFNNILEKVEEADFKVTSEDLNHLDKAVHKDLCKKWGCAEKVIVV